MKKSLCIIWIVAALLLAGCGTWLNSLPSVCDDSIEPSVLCSIAKDKGIRLENVGLAAIGLNAVLIGEGVYTREEAISVLQEIRQIFDGPVSYLFARGKIYEAIAKYPGMEDITNSLMDGFTSTKIMYDKDREIMITWLDNRITSLKK